MAYLSITTILDRIHAINETLTITGVSLKKFRYFPTEFSSTNMPFITPTIGQATYSPVTSFRPPTVMDNTERIINLVCVLGDWTQGVYVKNILELGEKVTIAVQQQYSSNPMLCVTVNSVQTKLPDLFSPAYIRSDTGVIGYPNMESKAAILFQLVVHHYLK